MPISHKTVANPLRRLCLAVTTSNSTKSFTGRTLQRRVSTDVQTAVSRVFLPLHGKRPVSVLGSHTHREFWHVYPPRFILAQSRESWHCMAPGNTTTNVF